MLIIHHTCAANLQLLREFVGSHLLTQRAHIWGCFWVILAGREQPERDFTALQGKERKARHSAARLRRPFIANENNLENLARSLELGELEPWVSYQVPYKGPTGQLRGSLAWLSDATMGPEEAPVFQPGCKLVSSGPTPDQGKGEKKG